MSVLILLYFKQRISSVVYAIWNFVRLIQIHHYLSEEVTKTKNKNCSGRLQCNSLLTGCPKYLLSKHQTSNMCCFCFVLRSFLIRHPSTFYKCFTFTLLPGSPALLQTPEYSEYHPSEQSPVVSAPVIWNQLRVSVPHSISVSSFKSLLKPFSF